MRSASELRLQRCGACGATWHPPLPACPTCRAASPQWYAAQGHGVIESHTVVHQAAHPAFADRVPYVVVAVRLAEGPLVVANLVGATESGDVELTALPVPVGTAVRVVFTTIADGVVLPQFVADDR